MIHRVPYIDSHTGGEPTRLILTGGPDLGPGGLGDRAAVFRSRHGGFRAGVIEEPRGSDAVVGGLLCQPVDPSSSAAVIFFNNVSTLGMCGHGTMGLIASLHHLGQIGVGAHQIETPVGVVRAELHADGRVSVENVASWRYRSEVAVEVEGLGSISGDIAWGGNWFFIARAPEPLEIHARRVDDLLDVTSRIRMALERDRITGDGGALIDHIELQTDSDTADARCFVLCPGMEWDRSPCGTGTSAKLACLAADGALAPGQLWLQESPVGSIFEASYRHGTNGQILPRISGRAHVMAEGELLFDDTDPFREGIPR